MRALIEAAWRVSESLMEHTRGRLRPGWQLQIVSFLAAATVWQDSAVWAASEGSEVNTSASCGWKGRRDAPPPFRPQTC